jgi:hypothetical protein
LTSLARDGPRISEHHQWQSASNFFFGGFINVAHSRIELHKRMFQDACKPTHALGQVTRLFPSKAKPQVTSEPIAWRLWAANLEERARR